MSIEICLSIEGAMQCVLPTQHRGDHRYLFVDDNGITIGALTSAEYDAWRVENAPCARCGMPRAFAPHNQTAAAPRRRWLPACTPR